MNPIAQAVHDVAEGRCEGKGVPGKWRVYADDGQVWFENMAAAEPAVVVCTVLSEVDG